MTLRGSLILIGTILFIGISIVALQKSSFHALRGSLTEPNIALYEQARVLIDLDVNNLLTPREMRRALKLAITKIGTQQISYDFSQNGIVNKEDLILFVHSIQYLLTCGNGEVIAPETCDDENTNADDGCSAICTTEAGFTCTGNPSTCAEEGATSVCGDETVNEGEQCDDSNTISGDGCSGTETSAPNGACQNEFCGDGFVDTDGFGGDLTTIEQCDDGGVCQGGSNDGNPCTKFLDDSACGESGTCMKVNSVACSSTCTLPTP